MRSSILGNQVIQQAPQVEESLGSYSQIVAEAIDLYKRGLNVFPVPRPEVVKELANRYPEKFESESKMPYILQPLYFSRMHLCGWWCKQETNRTGNNCPILGKSHQFEFLFASSNLAAMLGRTSGNLVCVDCDNIRAFEECRKKFMDLNLPFWEYKTSRGGNILFRLKEGEVKNSNHSQIPGVEIWGNHHYCVLPPSVHPSGDIYYWTNFQDPRVGLPPYEPPPLLTLDLVAWLGIELISNHIRQVDSFELPTWTQALSMNNRQILVSGINKGERNLLLTKAVYDVAAAIKDGYVRENEAFIVLEQAAKNCNPPYSISKIRNMLRSALKKSGVSLARDHIGYTSRQHSDNIQLAINFSYYYRWNKSSRTGLTDKVVFDACIYRSILDKKVVFRASSREIASIANIQKHETAIRSLKRLCKNGILTYGGRDQAGANLYKFGKVVLDTQRTTINTTGNSGPINNYILQIYDKSESDVFSKLGRVAHKVWKHLLIHPEGVKAHIARNCSLNYSSVLAALKKLMRVRLVSYSQAEGLFIGELINEEDMLSLSERLGVAGRTERRNTRFQREREIEVNQKILRAQSRLFRLLYTNEGVSYEG